MSQNSNIDFGLPVVVFQYPASDTSILKTRLVRVTEMNSRYVQGFEVANINDSNGKFKRFSLNRIVRNGVSLVSFGLGS